MPLRLCSVDIERKIEFWVRWLRLQLSYDLRQFRYIFRCCEEDVGDSDVGQLGQLLANGGDIACDHQFRHQIGRDCCLGGIEITFPAQGCERSAAIEDIVDMHGAADVGHDLIDVMGVAL